MKAILVIDLNDAQLNEWDTDTSKCWAEIKVHTPIKGGAHGIGCIYANDNVELKHMPQKKKPMRFIEDSGYNECIDEILGGE